MMLASNFYFVSMSMALFPCILGTDLKLDDDVEKDWDSMLTPDEVTGNMPLHNKISNREFRDAIKLIEAGKGVNALNKRDESPIFFAVREESLEVVQALIENGAELNLRNKDYCWPLDVAVETGNLDILDVLLNNGADVHGRKWGTLGRVGFSPLMRSVIQNHYRMAEKLLEKKTEVDFGGSGMFTEYGNMTPLEAAVYKIHEELVDLLLKHRANIHRKGRQGGVLLHLVVQVQEESDQRAEQLRGRDFGNVKRVRKTRVPNIDLTREQRESLERIVDNIVGKGYDPCERDICNVMGTCLNYAILVGDEVAFDIFTSRIRMELTTGKKGPWMNTLLAENRYNEGPVALAKRLQRVWMRITQSGLTEGLTKLSRTVNDEGEDDKDTLLIYKRENYR